MPTYLHDLFPPEQVAEAIRAGYVRQQFHPELPLLILNYTEKAQYERHWTPVTRICRGLIVEAVTGEVVAWPFGKFFNYGEPDAPSVDLSAPCTVFDKLDGSLGIVYPTPDGPAVATRGSFTSEQALHATQVLRTRYAGWQPPSGITVCLEIIYPGNRIVVDYGDTDDLFLLAAIDNTTGRTLLADAQKEVDWPGPVAQTLQYRTLAGALAAPPRPNAEGMVVWFPGPDLRLKIKQDDYIKLHRAITGMSARAVWELLGAGETVADICAGLPDELHGWVQAVAGRLENEARRVEDAARAEHEEILRKLGEGWTRKDYAALATASPYRPLLFLLLDGKDVRPQIWKSLRPSGGDRPVSTSEDTA